MRLPQFVRRSLVILFLALVVYVGSYCCLSACGGYYFGQSGRVRYNFGFAVSDVSMWHAKFTRWQRFQNNRGEEVTRGNTLGYLYCPMIILDRRLVHQTRPLFDDGS